MAWQQSATAGGDGGNAFSDDLTQVAKLAGFIISSGWFVDGIQGIYQRCDESQFKGPWNGGGGGSQSQVVFATGEYIINVSGYSGWYIDQITIQTNLQKYGPYGQQNRGTTAWNVGWDNIGGFFGSAGQYVDKLGFFYPSCPGPSVQ